MEVWKNWIYTYQVSNLGNIRNSKTGNILKTKLRKDGYVDITISLGSRKNKRTFKVHRIIAEVFLSNPNNLPQINHKNGIKTDNRVDNLEWCSQSENIVHGFNSGLYKRKLTKEEIDYIKEHYIPKDKEFGRIPLAKKIGVSTATITRVFKHNN